MKLIPTKIPNVYGVKVPMDAEDFEKQYNRLYYTPYPNNDKAPNCYIKIPFDFKILGTLTKDEISFDASEVVDSGEIDIEQYDGIFVATPRFWDYELESFSLSSSDESFRSALPDEIKENEKLLILQKL